MPATDRVLDIDLPPRQSAFLWGARKTGKSTYLRRRFPDSLSFDLLDSDLLIDLLRRPALLRERLLTRPAHLLAKPVIIDEVQKAPQLLDEVHRLIEERGLRFILCGSSARKLKRGRANLLGGRAWRYEMFPFVTAELDGADLLRVLNRGMIPSHYLAGGYRKSLAAYLRDYLAEEVFAEGLTRNVGAFVARLRGGASAAGRAGGEHRTGRARRRRHRHRAVGELPEPPLGRRDHRLTRIDQRINPV